MDKAEVKRAGRGAIVRVQWDEDEELEEAVIVDVSETGSRAWVVVDDTVPGKPYKSRSIGIISAANIVEIVASHNDNSP